MRISFVKTAYAIVVLGGVVYAFIELRGPNGMQGFFDKRYQVREYESANEGLRREIEQKQERIKRLQSDAGEQELEIRRRLKLAAPGEKIYIIDNKNK